MSPPTPISPSFLVARYLRSNNYDQTLEAFIKEAGLPKNAGSATGDESDSWTIEQTLEEKTTFDKSLRFERAGEDGQEGSEGWTVPAPSNPTILETPSPANILSVSARPLDVLDDVEERTIPARVLATDASRCVNAFDVTEGCHLVKSIPGLCEAPIISHASLLDGKYLLTTCTSGQVTLSKGEKVIERRKDHTKFAVKVITYQERGDSKIWVATAGWDSKVCLYTITVPREGEDPSLGEPVALIRLTTYPESIQFVRNKDTGDLILLLSRHDSTMLHYYEVKPPTTSSSVESQPYECRLLGRQNLAPGSNAWIAFSPVCLAISPHDPELVAVAATSLPRFMKLLIVRLLFPINAAIQQQPTSNEPETQATQARRELAIQNREDAAIVINVNTFAPVSDYSNPQVVWRPDGSGVWVNADDGVIRGVEAKTGKVITSLANGHEAGNKVRAIWAGWVDIGDGKREEWVVSGGYDKRLVVWRVKEGDE
ncbi:hypothetical protein FQN54_008241 [Arachnomyces sp. PD_36]|nr:hypothetical protein FQN54_008241 [Arachnomyces sp. PD_36]